MGIGTCILIILAFSSARALGGKRCEHPNDKGKSRWSNQKPNQELKNPKMILIVSMIIAISYLSGAWGVSPIMPNPPSAANTALFQSMGIHSWHGQTLNMASMGVIQADWSNPGTYACYAILFVAILFSLLVLSMILLLNNTKRISELSETRKIPYEQMKTEIQFGLIIASFMLLIFICGFISIRSMLRTMPPLTPIPRDFATTTTSENVQVAQLPGIEPISLEFPHVPSSNPNESAQGFHTPSDGVMSIFMAPFIRTVLLGLLLAVMLLGKCGCFYITKYKDALRNMPWAIILFAGFIFAGSLINFMRQNTNFPPLNSEPFESTLAKSSVNSGMAQNLKIQNLPEEVQDVIRTSLAVPTVQLATGPMVLLTVFGNLFVISIIANIMGRKNPNFRKTKRAASLVIWCLFLGILFMVNNQRSVISQMQSVRVVSTTSSEKPELFQNNGIVPIPEKVQAELRSELKQAATPGTSPKSNQSKKPTKPMPEDIVEYKLQSAPCATKEKARAEVEEKLRQLIAERLKKYNLTDEQSIRTTVESLPRKTVISEAIKEVAGEKYPIYTGTIEITLGRDFDRGIVRQLTSLSARNRYEWLMAGSVLAVVFLALLDRFFLAGVKSAATSTS